MVSRESIGECGLQNCLGSILLLECTDFVTMTMSRPCSTAPRAISRAMDCGTTPGMRTERGQRVDGAPQSGVPGAKGRVRKAGAHWAADEQNRLTAMTMKSGLPTGMIRKRLEFTYDYLGRRVEKKVLNSWTGTSGTTATHLKYVYDGHNLIAELNGSNNTVLSTYVWGLDLSGTIQGAGGVGGLLMVREGSKTYFPAYDGNGNVSALLDSADGSLDAKYEYGAFGEPLRVGGTTIAEDNPFRYSTKYTDEESGLVYYGFRYYSPSLGRFLNRDPIGELGGSNLYAFVENDPVNGWDYLGLDDELICTAEEYMEGLCDDANEYRYNWRVDRLRREAEASRARALELAVDLELLRMEGCFGGGCEVPPQQKPLEEEQPPQDDDPVSGPSILEEASSGSKKGDSAEDESPRVLAMSKDVYVPDKYKHGGPHVDRYRNGKKVGRYRRDGSPIRHKGKLPPPIPVSDKKKFEEAAKKLDSHVMPTLNPVPLSIPARVGMVITGTAALIWLIGNDASGVGVIDNIAIPAAAGSVVIGITGVPNSDQGVTENGGI